MQQNKRNYYLQTMGIQPWVLRDAPKALPVIFMTHIDFTEKEAALLDKMLKSVGLSRSTVQIQVSNDKEKHFPHPAYLLSHPTEKRKAYAALGVLLEHM